MIIHEGNHYLLDEPLGSFLLFPEISKNELEECNTSIKVKDIQSFMVERKKYHKHTGSFIEFEDLNKMSQTQIKNECNDVYAVFCLTPERKYCVSSFYNRNTEPNFLHAIYTAALTEYKKINWKEVSESIKLFAALDGKEI